MAAKENTEIKKEEINNVTLRDATGNRYVLEFNSRVVKRMERNGFKVDTERPNTMIEELVTGAFQMHHKGMSTDKIMEIWRSQTKKDDLLAVLVKLYMKPLEDLMDEPAENADPTWETA